MHDPTLLELWSKDFKFLIYKILFRPPYSPDISPADYHSIF